jgi:hypothetical protein
MAYKLALTPTTSSYSIDESIAEVVRVQLQGGAGRYRRDIIGSTKIVNCTWITNSTGWEYLNAFYRVNNSQGGASFKMDLVISESVPKEHDVRFIPSTFKLSSIDGDMYTVTASLEVTPLKYSLDDDMNLLDIVGYYGIHGTGAVFNQLEHLVNVDLPKSMHR